MKRARYKHVISMRLSSAEIDLLNEISALVPLVPRLTLARWAMLVGIRQIKKDPRVVVGVTKSEAK